MATSTTRVWESFLTERDKRHLAAGWAKQRPHGLGGRPALLVIDDSVGILGTERVELLDGVRESRFRMGLDGWAAVDRTRELLEAARGKGVQVIFTTLGRPHPGIPYREPDDVRSFAQGTDVVAELAPLPTEVVLGKSAASGFQGTSMLSHLIASQVDTIVVCGNSTSGCVRATVVEAAGYGYRVAVVEDCTFDRTEASHAMSLFDMDQKYADIIDLDTAVAYLANVQEGEPRASRLVADAWASGLARRAATSTEPCP